MNTFLLQSVRKHVSKRGWGMNVKEVCKGVSDTTQCFKKYLKTSFFLTQAKITHDAKFVDLGFFSEQSILFFL